MCPNFSQSHGIQGCSLKVIHLLIFENLIKKIDFRISIQYPNTSMKVFGIIQSFVILGSVTSYAAVTTFSSRAAFEAQTFTITTSEDFSTSTLDQVIGDTVANRFTSGVITISSNVRDGTDGTYRASIKCRTHPDRANNSQFAAVESFGSQNSSVDLQNETVTILLSGANQVFGMDLGSFAGQTTAFFRTNLGNASRSAGAEALKRQFLRVLFPTRWASSSPD